MYLFRVMQLIHLHLSNVGTNFASSSRLISRKHFETDVVGLTAAIRDSQSFLGSTSYTRPVQIVAEIPAPKFQDNATIKEQVIAIDGIQEAGQVLRDYAPDDGTYINEADVYEPDHEESFWGTANVARLKDIKGSMTRIMCSRCSRVSAGLALMRSDTSVILNSTQGRILWWTNFFQLRQRSEGERNGLSV
jgi:hypothetical protein